MDNTSTKQALEMREAALLDARMLSSNVRELTFAVGQNFGFEPGQWVNLFFPEFRNEQGNPLKRAYSIASGPRNNGTFDLAVTRVADGPGSTGLHSAVIGQSFKMSGPHGVFVLAPMIRPVIMVATGTGVAPFRSMLHAIAESGTQPIALLFGVRDESEILYREEFEGLAQLSPLFTFYPILSRANPRFRGKCGHVQIHLKQVMVELGGTNCDVYVCGLARMVHDVRRILLEELGLERKHIHIERYD